MFSDLVSFHTGEQQLGVREERKEERGEPSIVSARG